MMMHYDYKGHAGNGDGTWLVASKATVSICLDALSRWWFQVGEVDESDFVVEGDEGRLASLLLSAHESADVCVDVALYAWTPWSDTMPVVLLLFCMGDGTLDDDDDDNGGCCCCCDDAACPYAYAYILLLPLVVVSYIVSLDGIVRGWCCKDDDDEGRWWWWWQWGWCAKVTSSMYTSMLDTINHETQKNNKKRRIV